MDFTTLVESRYSVRSYKRNRIGAKKLHKVLQAMRLAPTATNNQAFQFIVIHTKGREEELRRIYNKNWFVQTPVVVCACGIPAENWVRSDGKNYNDVDVAIAMDHLILAATNEGLGTCWIGAFDAQAAKEALGPRAGGEPIVFP